MAVVSRLPEKVEMFDVRFAALRNAHYHMSRQAWFDGLNRVFSFAIILSGTALAWQVSQQKEFVGIAVAVATTVIGALQLVFDLGGQARTHEFLKKRYYEVVQEIEKLESPATSDKSRLKSQLLSLSAEEPPVYRALDATAHNQIVDSIYGVEGKEYRCPINIWQKISRHLLRHTHGVFTGPN